MKKTNFLLVILLLIFTKNVYAIPVSINDVPVYTTDAYYDDYDDFDDFEDDDFEEDEEEEEPGTHTITYFCEGYVNPNPTTFSEDETLILQPATRPGYEFIGWYDVDRARFVTKIAAGTTNDVRLQIFAAEEEYSITYNLAGGKFGSLKPKKVYTINSEDFNLLEPEKNGYDFIGWTGSNGAEPESVSILKGTTGDKNYLANWLLHEYQITYDLDDGYFQVNETMEHLYTFNMLTDTFMLPNDTNTDITIKKDGSEFLGWIELDEDGEPITNTYTKYMFIYRGTMTDKFFQAYWHELPESEESESIEDEEDEYEEDDKDDDVKISTSNEKIVKSGSSSTDGKYKVTNSTNKTAKTVPNASYLQKESITIGKSVKIKNVSFKITEISNYTFKDHTMLKTVTIGSNVSVIGKSAFKGCKNLTTVKLKTKNLKKIKSSAFKDCSSNITFKVPKTKIKEYKSLIKKSGLKKFKIKAL